MSLEIGIIDFKGQPWASSLCEPLAPTLAPQRGAVGKGEATVTSPSLALPPSVSGGPPFPLKGTQCCSQPGPLRWLRRGAENKLVLVAALQIQQGWLDL